MKKKLLFLPVLLMLLTGCGAGQESPQFISTATLQEFLENGVVVGTSEYYYTYLDKERVERIEEYEDDVLINRSYREFDDFGNLTRVTTERSGTTTVFEYRNTLDDAGRILRQEVWEGDTMVSLEEHTYDSTGNETSRYFSLWNETEQENQWHSYTMTYDRRGNLLRKETHRYPGDNYTILEYENGLCIREDTYHEESGQLTERIETIYDRKGNPTKKVSLNPITGKIQESWEYTYDRQGRCIRESRHGKSEELKHYREYVYDDTARTKTSTLYRADGTQDGTRNISAYDEYGNEILREMIRDGEVYWRIRYRYELLNEEP